MFNLINDTFNINEIVDSSSAEVLLENELTLPESNPDIEKIISTEGRVKINSTLAKEGSVNVDGTLTYNIIYRSNDEETTVSSMSGKIPFTEEISVAKAKEGMLPQVNPYIDYIDADLLDERRCQIKSVISLDMDIINEHPVDYVSDLESDGTFQAKAKNIKYTDKITELSEEVDISDAVEINKNSDEIDEILKDESEILITIYGIANLIFSEILITNIDVLDDKMLVEGNCKVGFLYTEKNSLNTTGYVSEEFPFTHYIEIKNSSDNMLKDIDITIGEMTYSTAENYDDEKKLIEFKLPFTINAVLYDTIEKNIITDCYSTDCFLNVESDDINLTLLRDIVDKTVKYENNFDIVSGSIKDIYTADVSPKISEKRIFDDKYVVDGFLDVNMLYLNGDINKIDKAYASLPFTASIDLKEDELSSSNITSDINISKSGAYRKGNSSVIINCDINVKMKLRDKEEISIINNITEGKPIERNKMPSLVFRVVQPGETIWDIAKNYNLSINYLKELNDIPEDNTLDSGSKIIIARMV